MRAVDLKMDELLDFRPDEGTVFLKDTRVLIENADAFGALRKDLVSTLGFERAKGFLIRYGWACGRNDAFNMKDKFKWEDELEWEFGGIALHTLEGKTKVDHDIINIDLKKKKWLLKGRWTNSYEAEQHLHYIGTHNSPVCWTLIGYAGGYASVFLGKRVIYKEIKCLGMGASHCEFIGKTEEEWGDEIASELPYYEEMRISEELEAAQRRIQLQNQELQRAFAINKKLTELVLNGEGMNGITQTLASIIDESVLVFDNRIHLITTHIVSKQKYLSNLQKRIKDTLKNIMAVPGKEQEYNTLITRKVPLPLRFKIEGFILSCVIYPLVVGNEILGFITTVKNNDEETSTDSIMAIQHSTSVFALEIIKQKSIVDLEQQLRGDFLESLLFDNKTSEESMYAWALRLGHDLKGNHSILVFDITNDQFLKDYTEEKILLLRKDILRFSDGFIKKYYPSVFCGIVNDKYVILFPQTGDGVIKNDLLEFISSINERFKRHYSKMILSMGVGKIVASIDQYPGAYKQAAKALDICHNFKPGKVIFYDELGSLAVLIETQNKAELLNFMNEKLGPLFEHDRKYKSNLIETLEQYLESSSIQQTSKKASMSISGLKYRLGKIKELKYNLQSQQERFDLQLALKIFKLVQVECGSEKPSS